VHAAKRILAAGEAMGEQRKRARLADWTIQQRGECLPSRIGEVEAFRGHFYLLLFGGSLEEDHLSSMQYSVMAELSRPFRHSRYFADLSGITEMSQVITNERHAIPADQNMV
jgi:hypothetical protein